MADSSQTKSEAASPRRRQDSRDRGQVATSNDFASAMILLLLLLLMSHTSFSLGYALLRAIGDDLPAAIVRQELTLEQSVAIGRASSTFLLRTALVLLVGSVLAAIGGHVSQIGFRVTPQTLAWKPERLSPASGVKKIFSLRGVVRLGMAIGKFVVCTAAIAATCYFQRDALLMQYTSLADGVVQTWGLCLHVCMMGTLALIAIGAVDLVFQRWQHENDMKMTQQEVKEETKENEGDAQVKARIRKLQSEAIKQRSLKDVPTATVVITNPTHFAVAIRYDRETMPAPRVVAKGKGHLAQQIKRKAAEAGIPQFERKSVARALYASTEIGDEIPTSLYRAVAEILAYVFGLKV